MASFKILSPSDTTWLMAITGASVVTLPLLIGVATNALLSCMMISMGSMVFLYFPKKKLSRRLRTLIIVSLGMQLALVLGLLTPVTIGYIVPVMMLIVFVAIWLTRVYQLNPPGALYFIITGCVALILPIPPSLLPSLLGWFALGNLWAVVVAFVYSLAFLREHDQRLPIAQPINLHFRQPAIDAALMAVWLGLVMTLAMMLGLQRPYWVPVCCVGILQTANLNLAWQRSWQMISASSIGLFIVWLVFLFPVTHGQMTILLWLVLIPGLWLLFRHYFLAMLFITPMTIIMVEFSLNATIPTTQLIIVRWVDIVIGVTCGLIGQKLLNNKWVSRLKGGTR